MKMHQPMPVDAICDAFVETLTRAGRVVVTAPTGSGKSTRLPVWSAEAFGRTLVVEPRRVACRSLARFVAQSLGEQVGGVVGYTVRYDAKISQDTRIAFATPGVVLQKLHTPHKNTSTWLDTWDTLILDEFHERGIETDVLLAFALSLNIKRLVVTSATLDADRIARHIDARVLHAQGRLFPVDVVYQESPPLPSIRNLEQRVENAVETAFKDTSGDILVFLPGKGEIHACQSALSGIAKRRNLDILPLHAGLEPSEQDRVFQTSSKRRVILATNVAETSLTIPGVTAVIDSGLVRQTRYHRGEGVLRLVQIAQDSAEQRRGRAGRLGPGLCIRLWSQRAKLDPTTPPELLRENLEDTVLRIHAAGFQARAIPLLDRPPSYAIDNAVQGLLRLGCLSEDEAITPIGRRVAALPLPVHFARVLSQACDPSSNTPLETQQDALDLVAVLASGRRLFLPARDPSEERAAWRDLGCDASMAICALRRGKPGRDKLHHAALLEARKLSAQLHSILSVQRAPKHRSPNRRDLSTLWLQADPYSAFVRRKKRSAFAGHGTEVFLGRESTVDPDTDALIVPELHTSRDSRGRMMHTAICPIPTPLIDLSRAHLGTLRPDNPRVQDGAIVCDLKTVFSGRILASETRIPEGQAARDALLHLLRGGRLFREALDVSAVRAESHALYLRVERSAQGDPVDLDAWVAQRVDEVGLESGDELALLSEDDFTLPWPAPLDDFYTREPFLAAYPVRLDLGDFQYRVEYKIGSKVVTLIQTSGPKRKPSLKILPAWGGWSVRLQQGNAVHVLRG